jgi:HAMP domain-containing protein
MSPRAPEQQQPRGGGRTDRKLKNYLLDARFQLKFAGYFVAMTLVVAALLGAFLVRTTDSLFARMNDAVDARSRAAEVDRELGTCTLNNDLSRNMDDPGFAATLEQRSKAIADTFAAETRAVLQQRAELVRQQQVTIAMLLGLLVAFIAVVALGAIVITHRIVGPLFRLKRMAREVAAGVLQPPTYGLRPGDELREVFELFAGMVGKLRAQAEADLATVEAARAGDAGALARLHADLAQRLARK